MNLMEIIIVSVGLSLDVFVAVAYIGAGFSVIKKGNAAGLGVLFSLMQVLALILGNLITVIPALYTLTLGNLARRWYLMSVIIFIGLGIYMFYKALHHRPILERRRDAIPWKQVFILSMITSIDSLFAGVGFGFLDTKLLTQALSLFTITVLQVMLGIAVGYWIGAEHGKKAYCIGSALLLIAGIDIIIHYLI